ncbi:MAG: winged helix-turn-helix transcriptional regulator, partial [Nitrosotalea sp.]
LKDLEGYGLVERKILKNRPLEVEYNLTEKGMALESILTEMIEFSKVFKSKNTFEDGKQDEIFLGSKTRLSSVYDY